MGRLNRHIAVLCDYRLMPERVGGMDAFFVRFDEACKSEGISVDWFFPNAAEHSGYRDLRIFPCPDGIERGFLGHIGTHAPSYTAIVTHFLELCTPFCKAVKASCAATLICADHNPRPLGGYPLKKRIEKRLKGWLYARYIDRFVAVSGRTARQLAADFGAGTRNRTCVIYNGIDLSRIIEREAAPGAKRFLVLCHLRPEKAVDDLITATALLAPERREGMRIDIYGDGPCRQALEKKVSESGQQSLYAFHGNTERPGERYAHYDYLVHPSRGETFCYTVVESLIAGLPAITTQNEGNVLGLVRHGENGFLYGEGDTGSLAEILTGILSGKAGITHVRDARDIAARFSLDGMVDQYIRLLSR